MNRLTFIIMLAGLHLLEGRANIFTFCVCEWQGCDSFLYLVCNAGHIGVWSESTVLTYRSFSLSTSHLMTDFKVASWVPQNETPSFITSDDQLIIRELVVFLEWGGIVTIFSSKSTDIQYNSSSMSCSVPFSAIVANL